MPFTIQCRGQTLGTTELDFDQLVSGQHSGWLEPDAGAQSLLDSISIGYPSLRAWLLRNDRWSDGNALASPTFLASGEYRAITENVAARLPFVLSLHREDGSEIGTTDIVLQDRHYWDMPWLEAELDAAMDDEKRAEVEAAIAHDIAVLDEWFGDRDDERDDECSDGSDDNGDVPIDWPEPVGLSPRYQVHLRLLNPADLPESLITPLSSRE